MKKCKRCGEEKPLELFSKNKRKKDGRQIYCKECYKKINNDTYRRLPKRRLKIREYNDKRKKLIQDLIIDYLSDKKCELCGFDNILALDFHHRNREEKEFTVTTAVRMGYSKTKIEKEIKKCSILCANCHRILEAKINKSYKSNAS